MRFVSANLDYTRPGTRPYIAYLVNTYRPGILCMQERTRGLRGTRVRGMGRRVARKRFRALGAIGAHRGVAVGRVKIGGRSVRVLSVHGLHVRTVGRARQDAFYWLLTAWVRRMSSRGHLWVVAGDFNRKHTDLAALLGGQSIGQGVDGIVVSPGLDIDAIRIDRTGIERGWTDHPAIVANVRLRR